MFGATLECGIKAVKVKVQHEQGRVLRRCRVVLSHEFDADIARELGKDARALRQGLRDNAIEKATLPLDGIAALGAFTADGKSIEIGRMIGVKASCSKAKDSEAGPTIELEFEFSWDEKAWVFLGRNCSSMASVVLTKRQLALAAEPGSN
jgi:hypothetical protein